VNQWSWKRSEDGAGVVEDGVDKSASLAYVFLILYFYVIFMFPLFLDNLACNWLSDDLEMKEDEFLKILVLNLYFYGFYLFMYEYFNLAPIIIKIQILKFEFCYEFSSNTIWVWDWECVL
jgi:hypothetical protein